MLRKIVIQHYGGRCKCGESTYEFLTIDHRNGGGSAHRRKIGANNIARWIIKNNFPENIQILCWNCNCKIAYKNLEYPVKQLRLENIAYH